MRHYRCVIRITAEDSPNVQYARAQQAMGMEPTDEVRLPGVLTWAEYQKRLALWDEVAKCVKLRAEFWEGAEFLLFPTDWLDNCEKRWKELRGGRRYAKAVGIDPGEGGANTAMFAVDEYGVVAYDTRKTPNTAVIDGNLQQFGKMVGVPDERWFFDRGGGGKQVADRMRSRGMRVKTVAFGETVKLALRRGLGTLATREEVREEAYAYLSRRVEMYHRLSELCDPDNERGGFGLPPELTSLRAQLSVVPKLTDDEGRYYLPPKQEMYPNGSPDEADALVLAVHGMLSKSVKTKTRVF